MSTTTEEVKLSFDFKNTTFARVPLKLIRESTELLRPVNRESVKYKQVAESVRKKGVMQAVLLRELKDPATGETYYGMIDGNHRFTASLDAGFESIPAMIGSLEDGNVLEAQIIANSARVETTPVEYTKGLVRLFSASPTLTKKDLAARLDRGEDWIEERLGLVKLEESLEQDVDTGRIPLSSAYALSKLPPEKQVELREQALNQPATQFCAMADGIRKEIIKAKRDGRVPNEGFVPTERLQKIPTIKEQIEALKIGKDVSKLYQDMVGTGVTTLEEAALHVLKWILHVDPVSIAVDEAKWKADKAAAAAEKQRKAAEKARATLAAAGQTTVAA